MALDAYAACPCGSGKKIKFCAPKNSNAEMEKIIRAIEGDQRASALDQVKRLLDSNPNSDCLMRMKSDLEMMLGFEDAWLQSIDDLEKTAPHDPGSHLRRSLALSKDGEPRQASDKFQDAMDRKGPEDPMPIVALMALDALVESFMVDGNAATGSCLLWLQASILQQIGEGADQRLHSFSKNTRVPLAVKQTWAINPAAEDASWKEEYTAAVAEYQALRFRTALHKMRALAAEKNNVPQILRSVACFEQMLGYEEEALASWRKYIESGGISDGDVVSAMALVYWLDENQDTVEQRRIVYEVADVDNVREKFVDSDRLRRVNLPPQPDAEGVPPPQLAGHWLDAPLKEGVDNESRTITATIMFFGRETDREPRLEIVAWKDNGYEQQLADIREHFEAAIGDESEDELLSRTTLLGHLLGRQAFVGKVESVAQQQKFQSEAVSQSIESWLDAPADCLGGKSPRQAAKDPDSKLALAAYFFNMRGIADAEGWLEKLDPVRDELDLPLIAWKAGTQVNSWDISELVNRSFELLDDADLPQVVARADSHGLRGTTVRVLKEILNRPALKGDVDHSGIYMELARASDLDQAFEYFEKAKAAAVAEGKSPAMVLVNELSLRLVAGQGDEAKAILQTLEANHLNEPGVAEELQQLLTMGGQIDPSQMGEGAEAVGEPAGDEAPGGLWTPDSPTPSSDSGERKSKLWVPGMD